MRADDDTLRRKIFATIRRIPRGRVATYGQIAALSGKPRAPRAVGRALATLPRPMIRTVPWQRVVNASGGIARRDPEMMALQKELLEQEGVPFRGRWRIDLARAAWKKKRSSSRSLADRSTDWIR
jgi:methylated-DNA-protein-cysteine methyltransferase related protein